MARISSREILWNKISRTCFQDRVMPYSYWVKAISDRNHHEHKKVLDQSVCMLTGGDFVRLLGEREFVGLWKSIRDGVDHDRTATRQGQVILDGLWLAIMTGFAFGNLSIDIDKPLSTQLKATYLDICKYSTRNIYQVAQDINRPYSRVYGDVKKLQAIGLIKASSSKQAGRRVTLLSVA